MNHTPNSSLPPGKELRFVSKDAQNQPKKGGRTIMDNDDEEEEEENLLGLDSAFRTQPKKRRRIRDDDDDDNEEKEEEENAKALVSDDTSALDRTSSLAPGKELRVETKSFGRRRITVDDDDEEEEEKEEENSMASADDCDGACDGDDGGGDKISSGETSADANDSIPKRVSTKGSSLEMNRQQKKELEAKFLSKGGVTLDEFRIKIEGIVVSKKALSAFNDLVTEYWKDDKVTRKQRMKRVNALHIQKRKKIRPAFNSNPRTGTACDTILTSAVLAKMSHGVSNRIVICYES